ncbi:predicted protein [Phaeodactylum tricornutum CCAP 1055/1]|jgi:hypothetical protein|uniref:Uncharacterized protein n=2 Tax=Phaeodactylum tricornutum TaxID=2850 RepID=B7FRR4_PHATC|nr:predicted protein [Phaeodactylum tricornutum CCAP 1055/1]EEC50661.1 predicted protein [Phaeodactylum tricornutum CCAP 1055/1]|eukprot:XP_002177847.1 predicted protein [Phaeodactylum tricornutum CCAP 1055/1]
MKASDAGLFLLVALVSLTHLDAFVFPASASRLLPMTTSSPTAFVSARQILFGVNMAKDGNMPTLKRVPEDMEGVPTPFVDVVGNSFIECFADSVAFVDGIEYTIGVPCDYSVALCYFGDDDQLVPVELDDALMDDIFPMAESIVAEEFGEELVLQRTPQTLTLVGELEDDDDEEALQRFEEGDESSMEDEDDEEEVEVLLTFEHRNQEFNLVRLLDPILLVGKVDPSQPDNRILLTPEESDKVMPILEELFLEFQDEPDDDMMP